MSRSAATRCSGTATIVRPAPSCAPMSDVRVDPERKLEFLAHAEVEARRRGLHDVTIVDCDCHHYETQSLPEIARHIAKPAIRRVFERYSPAAIARQMMPGTPGDR